MTKKEFTDRLTALGTMENDVERRSEIADLITEANAVFDSNENLTSANTTLNQDNESLRAANLKLFLKVGKEEEPTPGAGGNNEPKEKRSFDDLFNEKGGIK